jgi:hypothetical protein
MIKSKVRENVRKSKKMEELKMVEVKTLKGPVKKAEVK